LIEDFGEQLFLAGEMVVHRALRHAGSGGDLVHAGDVETVGTEFAIAAWMMASRFRSVRRRAAGSRRRWVKNYTWQLLVIGFDAT
jgi:hypothetical protein